MADHYHTLNVSITAGPDQIHRSYRDLARRFHPDRNPGEDAAARMRRINEAYEWLRDPARREVYDRKFVVSEPVELRAAILDAAREALGPGDVCVADGISHTMLSVQDGSRCAIHLTGVLGATEYHQWLTSAEALLDGGTASAAISLACRVIVPDPCADLTRRHKTAVAVVELIGGRHWGGALTDGHVRKLLEPFIDGCGQQH